MLNTLLKKKKNTEFLTVEHWAVAWYIFSICRVFFFTAWVYCELPWRQPGFEITYHSLGGGGFCWPVCLLRAHSHVPFPSARPGCTCPHLLSPGVSSRALVVLRD